MSNKTEVAFNPLTGELEVVPSIKKGVWIKNRITASFKVKAGWTKLHPNLEIPEGKEVIVEDGGEIQS